MTFITFVRNPLYPRGNNASKDEGFWYLTFYVALFLIHSIWEQVPNKYFPAIYFEHCVMMSNYVIIVYVSSDLGTYMVRIRFAFQNRVWQSTPPPPLLAPLSSKSATKYIYRVGLAWPIDTCATQSISGSAPPSTLLYDTTMVDNALGATSIGPNADTI